MSTTEFYYLDADGQSVRGPFKPAELKALVAGAVLAPATLVCTVGSEQWSPVGALPEYVAKPPPRSVGSGAAPARPATRPPVRKGSPEIDGRVAATIIIALLAGVGLLWGLITYSNAHPYSPSTETVSSAPTPDSWGDGYNQGVPLGREWGAGGHGVPTDMELCRDAQIIFQEKVHPPDEEQRVRGFISGFGEGYGEATKKAF